MNSRKIKTALNLVNKHEGTTIKALYWFSQGFDLNEIGVKIGNKSAGTARNRLKEVSDKLEMFYNLEGVEHPHAVDSNYPGITREVTDLVVATIGLYDPDWSNYPFTMVEEEPDEEDTPEYDDKPASSPSPDDNDNIERGRWIEDIFEDPQEVESLSSDSGGDDNNNGTLGSSRSQSEEPPRSRWRFLTITNIILAVVAGIIIFGAWILFFRNPFTGEPLDEVGIEPAPIAQAEDEDDSLPSPDLSDQQTAIALAIIATDTAEAPTRSVIQTRESQIAINTAVAATRTAADAQTAEAIPTDTPANTPTSTPSSTPTLTPTPSATPTSSVTPTPSPPELFFSFGEGIDESFWAIDPVESNYNIIDRQLVGVSGGLIITGGDESWRNYEIEIDFDQALTGSVRGNYVIVRKTDTGFVAPSFTGGGRYGDSIIYVNSFGEWETIAGTRYSIPSGNKIMTVRVVDELVSVSFNGNLVKTYVTDRENGFVGIRIGKTTVVNSVKITLLDQ